MSKEAATGTTKNSLVVGDCAKLLKPADLRFDICRDIEQVLKIGRDYQNKDGYRGAHYDTVKLLCDTIEYQQEQLETKTEVGNAAKLREAMVEILGYIESFHKYIIPGKRKKLTTLFAVADTIRDKARAALAAPARNCDVGTDNEQIRRWKEFCDHYEVDRSPESFARWAQAPYFEEGGDK